MNSLSGLDPTRTDVHRVQRLLTALVAVSLAACANQAEDATAALVAAGGGSVGFAAEPLHKTAEALADLSQELDASRRNAIVRAAGRVAPAVATIHTIRTEQGRPRSLWESFFLSPGVRRRFSGLGSGFVIDSTGTVLTNEHVIRGAERIMVALPDGRALEAELVGADEVTDVAVLRVKAERLPVAPLGTSRGLIIGEWAVAIGNPFGNLFSDTEPTVTAGVISAVGRHIVPGEDDLGIYLGMIQTDASINPGNSGGPLVNSLGQVVGVNSSIFSRSGGSEGLGFAIPIDRALKVAEDLLSQGQVLRAWLGLDVEAVEADVWGRTRGVRVSRVIDESPAGRAGIRMGARMLEAGGRRLAAPLDFEDVLLDLRAGDELTVLIEESQEPLTLQAESPPSVRAERVAALDELDLITLTPGIRAERRVESEEGALIADISPELERQIGFHAGDVIVRINNVPIRTADDAARVFRELQGRSARLRIYFERNGLLGVRDLIWRG